MHRHRSWQMRFGLGCFAAIVLALVSIFGVRAATYTAPRALNIGDVYELRRDGWTNPPSGSSYEGDVLPKSDANDGAGRDNPYFQRHNVARAWPTDIGYWFTGSDQHEGEPDPAGEQWVDYVPPFEILGPGRYAIDAAYRWSTNRASYPAVYRVYHALGTNEILRDQRLGSPNTTIYWISLGEFEMRPGSFVRVEDTGAESITFSSMRFRLVAPAPRLQIASSNGMCLLRWSTNASSYHLECAASFVDAPLWEPVSDPPTEHGDEFHLWLPIADAAKYFRLRAP